MKISIIIPLRLSEALFEGISRLEKLLTTVPAEFFDVLVVDYGSTAEEAINLQALVDKFANASVVRVNAEKEPFSAGIARNIGAQNAKTPVIMFHDVDCLASQNMYMKIHAEATARAIDVNSYDFFAIPVTFLTFEGVEEYCNINNNYPPTWPTPNFTIILSAARSNSSGSPVILGQQL